MANLSSIYSVGLSLVNYFRNTYPEPLRTEHPCEFRLISSGELGKPDEIDTAVLLYLYRVNIDQHARCKPPVNQPQSATLPLSINLHYLLIAWADNALTEHSLIAWVMSQLNQHPIMDKSILSPEGGWLPHDQVQIVPNELSNEDLFRIWDSLAPNYHLSVPYIARVIQIDPEPVPQGLPVVATRFTYGKAEEK